MEQRDLTILWKALADPKRRRIVQLLHEKAHTTGEICTHFDVSRFAIMRHLKVLEQAELIQTRREGRQRWNFLNDALFQEIQQTYLAGESNGDYQLQAVLGFLSREAQAGEQLVSPQSPLKQALHLPALPAQVFQALTNDVNQWWSYRLAADSHVYLEPQVGGRFYEAFSDGGGVLYATVTYLKPNHEIRLYGSLGMMDGIAYNSIHITLEPQPDESTCLQLTHYFSDQMSAVTMAAFSRSWEELLSQHLKAFIVQRFHTRPPA